jgi:hypothetical protein
VDAYPVHNRTQFGPETTILSGTPFVMPGLLNFQTEQLLDLVQLINTSAIALVDRGDYKEPIP